MIDAQKLIETLSEVQADYEKQSSSDPQSSLLKGFAGGLGLAINFIKKQSKASDNVTEIYVKDDVYFDESKLA